MPNSRGEEWWGGSVWRKDATLRLAYGGNLTRLWRETTHRVLTLAVNAGRQRWQAAPCIWSHTINVCGDPPTPQSSGYFSGTPLLIYYFNHIRMARWLRRFPHSRVNEASQVACVWLRYGEGAGQPRRLSCRWSSTIDVHPITAHPIHTVHPCLLSGPAF